MPTALVRVKATGTSFHSCVQVLPANWQEPLPADLADFASWTIGPSDDGGKAIPFNVGIWLRRCEDGSPELMPLRAVCDWLRDQGWEIKPSGWVAGIIADDTKRRK